ncbi:MAG: hypothetical protein OSA06_08090 [Acidimicrobiales bacterium]|nr:hypothetical protein [Acidimicrobiales bacterium]
MSPLPYFDADAINQAVSMSDAIAALHHAFQNLGPLHPRTQIPLGPTDDLLLMPAVTPQGIGIKTVTVVSDNPAKGLPLIHAHYLLCDRQTGQPLATFDGSALTALRTPAASGVATQILAQPDATTLGIFGTGIQAVGHLEAMLSVRHAIDTIWVTGRTPAASEAFVTRFAQDSYQLLTAPAAQTATADIICGCTSSVNPVIPTASVKPGAHINLVGSYSAARREVDVDLIATASVYVDEREAAQVEAGELIAAATGSWSFDQIAGDLAELTTGQVGRQNNDQITLFKSVGLAVEDVVVAAAVLAAQ